MSGNPSAPSALERIELALGDITRFAGDAIVNAANSSLLGGGGVDGAIHRAAGPELLEECRTLGGCPCGEARITRGYRLPARHVIHTVGPVYRDGRHGEPEKLRRCYACSLELAAGHGIETIAFPAISCGAYGYPIEEAARIAVETCAGFLAQHRRPSRVTFMLFDEHSFAVYRHQLRLLREERSG